MAWRQEKIRTSILPPSPLLPSRLQCFILLNERRKWKIALKSQLCCQVCEVYGKRWTAVRLLEAQFLEKPQLSLKQQLTLSQNLFL